MAKSYCNLLYHIVFSTKNREPWLTSQIRPRVHQYLGGAIKNERGVPLIINGTDNHVHILARLRQDKAVSAVVRDIKANSSGWMHDTFRNSAAFHWQTGYGGFTVSPSQVDKARRYIAGQEAHHRRHPFEREFILLLDRNGVEYDPDHVFD